MILLHLIFALKFKRKKMIMKSFKNHEERNTHLLHYLLEMYSTIIHLCKIDEGNRAFLPYKTSSIILELKLLSIVTYYYSSPLFIVIPSKCCVINFPMEDINNQDNFNTKEQMQSLNHTENKH